MDIEVYGSFFEAVQGIGEALGDRFSPERFLSDLFVAEGAGGGGTSGGETVTAWVSGEDGVARAANNVIQEEDVRRLTSLETTYPDRARSFFEYLRGDIADMLRDARALESAAADFSVTDPSGRELTATSKAQLSAHIAQLEQLQAQIDEILRRDADAMPGQVAGYRRSVAECQYTIGRCADLLKDLTTYQPTGAAIDYARWKQT